MENLNLKGQVAHYQKVNSELKFTVQKTVSKQQQKTQNNNHAYFPQKAAKNGLTGSTSHPAIDHKPSNLYKTPKSSGESPKKKHNKDKIDIVQWKQVI